MARRIAGWYDDAWTTRYAVSVPHTLSTSANDVSIVIPKSHPIWAILAAEGDLNSIRVTDGDGYTALTFELTDAALSGAFSTANKDGGIKVDNAGFITGTAVKLLWIYAGNPSATSGAGSVTLSSAKVGHLYQQTPPRTGDTIRAAPTPPGETVATPDVPKRSAESRRVWVGLNGILSGRAYPVEGAPGLESVWGVATSSTTGGGAAAVHDSTKTRFVEDADGVFYASVFTQSGSSGTDYTYILTTTTGSDMSDTNNTDQTLQTVFRLRVLDADES
jgi:hypothetical protein